MTAPTGSSEPVSPFLAFVGPQDRNLLRFGLWLTLGLPLALAAAIFVATAAHALEPELLKETGASGPHRLLVAGQGLCLFSFFYLAAALPFLGAARLAFQRPAWTFVSPARPFLMRLLIAGALVYGLLTLAIMGVEALLGTKLALPPLLDASLPAEDRIAYVLTLPPLLLMGIAAQELLLRGVILQVIAAFVRTRIGICVVNGLVSGLLLSLAQAEMNPMLFLHLAVTGAVFAYSVLELGGIEFSIGARFTFYFIGLVTESPASSPVRSPAFHWADLAKPEVLIDLGELATFAIGTALAVWAIKRYRKA